jgi:LEA14-like dessication related protein
MDGAGPNGSDAAMRTLSAAALLAVLAGCSHAAKRPPPPAPIPVVTPRVALEVPQVLGVGFSGADLLFRARVENPNDTALSVVRVEYGLDLEGKRAAQGAFPTALAVPPADVAGPGMAQIELPVRLQFAAVPGVAKVLALDREAEYALGGAVVFLTPAGEVRVAISAHGKFQAPRAPAFQVGKLLLRKAGPTEIALELQMQVTNPNAFEMPAGRVGCGVQLSGMEVVRADVVFADPIAAGATAAAIVPIKISPLRAGKAAARLLIPFQSVDASLKGEAVFGGVPVPLDLATSILPGQ